MQANLFRRFLPALVSCSSIKRGTFLTLKQENLNFAYNTRVQLFQSSVPMSACKNVGFAEFKELLENPQNIVIDVREKQELVDDGRIEKTHNIPLGEVTQALQLEPSAFEAKYGFPKPSPDSNLIFSCRSGKRSLNACGIAEKQGFKNLWNYSGGFLDWSEQTKGK
ncbi:unnamed protein product [Bemisia tabaci]|uniref:Rhodanese domain-containing protein n=1 Tax=Bemisia tabaci TaxID=7038 RepID=A0A9P0F5C5_BEMTA|nr:heat shock protein [Bemisia tabaci]CAH0392843.1 unnamed protein product [Bemisia tabaci]